MCNYEWENGGGGCFQGRILRMHGAVENFRTNTHEVFSVKKSADLEKSVEERYVQSDIKSSHFLETHFLRYLVSCAEPALCICLPWGSILRALHSRAVMFPVLKALVQLTFTPTGNTLTLCPCHFMPRGSFMPISSGSPGSIVGNKTRNVLFVLLGVAVLILKRHYSGPFQEAVVSYAGNIGVSFAVYFLLLQLPHHVGAKRLLTAGLALVVVELFEAFDGFGVMANVYDPLDFAANAVGVGLALTADTALNIRSRAGGTTEQTSIQRSLTRTSRLQFGVCVESGTERVSRSFMAGATPRDSLPVLPLTQALNVRRGSIPQPPIQLSGFLQLLAPFP
jgi:hypothetical protein